MVEGLTYIDSRAQGGRHQADRVPHHRPCSRASVHTSRGGAVAARRAHNPKVGGSNPSPATKNRYTHRALGNAGGLWFSAPKTPAARKEPAMTWVNHAQSLIAYNQWANAKVLTDP